MNSLVHGDECRAFEEEFARYCDAPYAISLTNGTAALELALRALEIGPGDEVIVPARSFFATTSAVVSVGAVPVFADVDFNSHTIAPASVTRLVTGRTRAIIAVHLAGWPCAMDELDAIARRHSLWLIEDCAQAHGARWSGKPVGSFGDAAAFSFCTDKIMSTGGEGGMLLLKDEDHWARAWAYKDHGKDPAKLRQPAIMTGFRYLHDSFGTNLRMTEMQAAIGRVQLRKLPRWLARRRRNAAVLRERLSGHQEVRLQILPDNVEHAFYKFYLLLEAGRGSPARARQQVVSELNRLGVPAGAGSCPDMSREAAVCSKFPPPAEPLRTAAMIGEASIMLPVDHLLGEPEMIFMSDALLQSLENVVGGFR